MKKLSLVIVLMVLSCTVNAQFDYLPKAIPGHQISAYEQYTLSYNEEHEQAEWVAYELTAAEASMKLDRCDCFKSDTSITTKSATLTDYKSSGFDRGHLAPAADNNLSPNANKQSFLMSNMSPQFPDFNRGIWADLERWVREKAIFYGKLYVVTGPVFVNNYGKMGKNEVTIPGYFYKAIIRIDENDKVKAIGFMLPNFGAFGNIKDYIVPINTLETLTGLDFFPALENRVEGRVEATSYPSQWEFY